MTTLWEKLCGKRQDQVFNNTVAVAGYTITYRWLVATLLVSAIQHRAEGNPLIFHCDMERKLCVGKRYKINNRNYAVYKGFREDTAEYEFARDDERSVVLQRHQLDKYVEDVAPTATSASDDAPPQRVKFQWHTGTQHRKEHPMSNQNGVFGQDDSCDGQEIEEDGADSQHMANLVSPRPNAPPMLALGLGHAGASMSVPETSELQSVGDYGAFLYFVNVLL